MKIQEIVKKLDISDKYIGFQLSKKNGFINSTWLLYKKNDSYYFFDINQKIEFNNDSKYSSSELYKEFDNSNFEIDLSIN
ncbi:hypothetical protein [Tenacibaculum piscium]|uniref:hypothetical protein n=1 Tax=Tenacibaculum piscium TaxID=1458515 RepID=UPI001F454CA2|nr:hypothetical protein [Tenacibaculum piscium]